MKEIWVIWLGNPGQFPYYVGKNKPCSACWEDGIQFGSREEAQRYIDNGGRVAGGIGWKAEIVRVK